MDFHVFVLVSTIAYYILLRRYKTTMSDPTRKSSLLYIFFVPFLLYLCRYFFPQSADNIITPSALPTDHSSIISSPYPMSSS